MKIIIGGIYKHYKGNKYQVLCIANHSESLEKLVIYKGLYEGGKIWARPLEMFDQDVAGVKRFMYLYGGEVDTIE